MGSSLVAAHRIANDLAIRVFLADSSDYFRDGLCDLLRGQDGIEVVGGCADPRAAAVAVARLRPDVVVDDLSTPHVSAEEAAALIRALSAISRVILLSLHSSREHVLRGVEAGACGYLLKDGAAEEIVHAVRTVHEGRLYFSARIADVLAADCEHLAATKRPRPR